jgi:hypothetical protein
MKKIIFLFVINLFCLQNLSFGQDETPKKMRSFVPKSQAYDIYYPLDFELIEGNDGIVTITDSISSMNITISAYQFEKRFKDVDIMTLINSFIKDSYKKEHKLEDWKSYKSKFDNLVELRTNYENYNWVWYGINNKKSLVVISINKETEINQSEINLLMFMIENLIIN